MYERIQPMKGGNDNLYKVVPFYVTNDIYIILQQRAERNKEARVKEIK